MDDIISLSVLHIYLSLTRASEFQGAQYTRKQVGSRVTCVGGTNKSPHDWVLYYYGHGNIRTCRAAVLSAAYLSNTIQLENKRKQFLRLWTRRWIEAYGVLLLRTYQQQHSRHCTAPAIINRYLCRSAYRPV